MGSVILLSLLVTTTFVVLCYMFNESRVELDSPTIAAMEAHTEALETRRRAEEEAEPVSAVEGEYADEPADGVIEDDVAIAPPPQMEPPDYEYREMKLRSASMGREFLFEQRHLSHARSVRQPGNRCEAE